MFAALVPGSLTWLPFALGSLALVGLVIFTLAYLAPWEEEITEEQKAYLFHGLHPHLKDADASPISLNQTVNGSGAPADLYSFTAPTGLRLVLQLSGASVLAGVYTGTNVTSKTGFLRVCGVNAWGVRQVPIPGPCMIQVTNASGGAYTLLIRKYNFWAGDDVKFYFHKSQC